MRISRVLQKWNFVMIISIIILLLTGKKKKKELSVWSSEMFLRRLSRFFFYSFGLSFPMMRQFFIASTLLFSLINYFTYFLFISSLRFKRVWNIEMARQKYHELNCLEDSMITPYQLCFTAFSNEIRRISKRIWLINGLINQILFKIIGL